MAVPSQKGVLSLISANPVMFFLSAAHRILLTGIGKHVLNLFGWAVFKPVIG